MHKIGNKVRIHAHINGINDSTEKLYGKRKENILQCSFHYLS